MPARRFRLDRPWIAASHDVVMAALSFVLALYLRLGGIDDFLSQTKSFLLEGIVLFTVISAGCFAWMRLYRGIWRYASLNDMIAIAKAVTLAILLFLMAMFLLTRLDAMPRSTLIINWLLLIVMLGGPRILYRLIKDGNLTGLAERGYDARIPVLLAGAGDASDAFLREMQRPGQHYRVVGLLDSDPDNVGRMIHGVRVFGGFDGVADAVRKLARRGERPQRLLLTDEDLPGSMVSQLLAQADRHGMTLARLPKLTDFRSGDPAAQQTQPVALEDLLGRPQTVLDRDAMAALVAGKRVLVTGAGGTIGGELARQIAKLGPARLALVDCAESYLFAIDLEIAKSAPDLPRRAILCDIRESIAVDKLFAREQPNLVFHAAALKQVPIAEFNPCEAVLTNVQGTRQVIDACMAHDISAFVMISTDKAVNPSSVMGATKRLAEMLCQARSRIDETKTEFVTVRFGNVLGSTGSVIPLFQQQLRDGGPLTVTHPDVTRYFMTVREAVELVLQASVIGVDDSAADQADSRGIFVLDMGEPVRIQDLARQMILLAGHQPDTEIEIVFTGLRPGEKLTEQLFHESEPLVPTRHTAIRLARPRTADAASLDRQIDALIAQAAARDVDGTLALLQALVPEYRSPQKTAGTAQ